MTAIKSRPLGKLEQYSSYRHNLRQYFAVIVGGLFSVNGQNSILTKEALYAPIAQLIKENTALATTIQNESSETIPHMFHLVEKMDLKNHLVYIPESLEAISATAEYEDVEKAFKDSAIDVDKLETNADFIKAMETRMSSKAKDVDSIPPWSIYIVPIKLKDETYGTFLAFSYHHSIGDGTTGRLVITKLGDILNKQPDIVSNPSSVSSSIVEIPESASLIPSMDEAIDLPTSIFSFIKLLGQKFGLLPKPHPWTGTPIVDTFSNPDEPISPTRVTFMRVPEDQMKRLSSNARAHSSSVTAAVLTAEVLALYKTLKSIDLSKYPAKYFDLKNFDTLISSVPRNLRQFAKPGLIKEDDMGVFVCGITIPFKMSKIEAALNSEKENGENISPEVAELLKSSKSFIAAEVAKGSKGTDVAMLKYVSDMADFFKTKVGEPHNCSIEVSSLLVPTECNKPEYKYKLSKFTFLQSASACGAPLCLSIISEKGSDMGLSITWCKETIVHEEFMEIFENNFEIYLAKLSK